MKILTTLLSGSLVFCACGTKSEIAGTAANSLTNRSSGNAIETAASVAEPSSTPRAATGQPKTVIEFFNLLPEKYFPLEGCFRETDKDCKNARAEYLKTFTEVADIKNGYFKGGCDGAQSCIEMAIFKRPDRTYLVGVATEFEMGSNFYFLDYADGKWEDVSATVVPEYSKMNWYELPRHGTTMKVYAKKIVDQGDDFEASEKGKLLYSLAWKDGRFTKVK